MIYLPEAEDIYFSKTREYFNEVLSSYANGNYRSAVVMLYSVAICDLLFKLQELSDMYNDKIAQDILTEIEKCRNKNDNKSKSKWEKELVDKIFDETELLDLEAYTNLNHLYDHRNFSAHPGVESVICLSTDKAIYPINAMGKSKSLEESVAIAKSRYLGKTRICCTRYGNVMCSRGSDIPLWIDRIKSGNPITV